MLVEINDLKIEIDNEALDIIKGKDKFLKLEVIEKDNKIVILKVLEDGTRINILDLK